jgi:ketol-acid reductoisomerase
VAPLFDDLYQRVLSGKETKRVLEANSAPDYREKLQKELDVIKNSEMWQTGAAVRSLRPERRQK